MRWLLGRLGNQRPHGRRVITPAHEGVVSTVWQSRHNSGLIHHMGIMPLTGTAPKKSYTRSSPASDSLNNPIPLLSTHCVWLERERANEQELLSERKKNKKKNIYLGPCSTAKADHLCSVKKLEALDIHAFSFSPQNKITRHSLLMALTTDTSPDLYRLGFSCALTCHRSGNPPSVQWPSPVKPSSHRLRVFRAVSWLLIPGEKPFLL